MSICCPEFTANFYLRLIQFLAVWEVKLQKKSSRVEFALPVFSHFVCRTTYKSSAASLLWVKSPLSMRLPKLEIPKFCGDAKKWLEFWDSYEAAIDKLNLLDVENSTI